MKKRCATLEIEYQRSQNANSNFELELAKGRLSKTTTELVRMILALNDARQQNTDFQRKVEQQRQVSLLRLLFFSVNLYNQFFFRPILYFQELEERIAKLTSENEVLILLCWHH